MALLGSQAQAAHQYLQCAPSDADASERAVIAIWKDKARATLYLSSDLEADEASGVIEMNDVSEPSIPTLLVLRGENTRATFTVMLDASVYWQRGDDVKVSGVWQLKDGTAKHYEEFRCFSRIYED